MINKNRDKDKKNVALKVENISKVFRVPHRKIDSMRSAFVNIFRKNYYEEFSALENISFEVKKGEFLGIIGHNGAGKSTLLKILASVYKPTSGKIKVNGMISPFLELGIGFNPELSGRDNIYLNATVLGLTKKQIDKKFEEIVAFAELEDFIDQQLKNYSSGMKVRLAFSVSIHANRDILLMDEVLAVGDSAFQEKCLDIFKDYKKKGRTVILVTHSMATVRDYCDRALMLDRGKILDIGNVDKVCDEYILNIMTESDRKELEKREIIESKEKNHKKRIRKKINDSKKRRLSEILSVDILNSNGDKIRRVNRGDSFTIEVKIKIEDVNESDFLAIQIIDRSNNSIICGNNTVVDKIKHNWKRGENIVRLEIQDNVLNHGDIYIKCVFLRKGQVNSVPIDSYNGGDKNQYLRIVQDEESASGIVYMKHKWDL